MTVDGVAPCGRGRDHTIARGFDILARESWLSFHVKAERYIRQIDRPSVFYTGGTGFGPRRSSHKPASGGAGPVAAGHRRPHSKRPSHLLFERGQSAREVLIGKSFARFPVSADAGQAPSCRYSAHSRTCRRGSASARLLERSDSDRHV